MSRNDTKQLELPTRKWVVVLTIACIVAIAASGYLAYVALTSSKVAGCGGGSLFNCGHVISSRWSLWMGMPVSLLAVGLYLSMVGSLFLGASSRFSPTVRNAGWALVSVLSISAGLAALWFISLQIFVLNHLCSYCLVAHCCGLIAASVIIWTRPFGVSGITSAAIFGFIGAGALIGGQLATKAPDTFQIESFQAPVASPEVFEFEAPVFESPVIETAPVSLRIPSLKIKQTIAAVLNPATVLTTQFTEVQETTQQPQPAAKSAAQAATPVTPAKQVERRLIAINGGTVQLDVAQWPLAGSKDAKYIFAEMFDYSCPHCRHTHAAIKSASATLNGDMAVLVLPIPLNSRCNNAIQVTGPNFTESCEIAKLSVAVWRVDPTKFADFHNWMFSTEQSPNYAAAKAHAESMVDVQKLNAELASTIPGQYIAKMVELYKRAGSGNVPKLIFPSTSIVGEFTSGDGLVEIIKQQIK